MTAGVFTTNRVKAAPVVLDMERLNQHGRAKAILVNSGNANACTGERGMEVAVATSDLVATELGVDGDLVQVASTGVIGEQLEVKTFAQAIPGLVRCLSPDGFDDVARAIMTTDTVPKTCARTIDIGGRQVSLFGMVKGSGMIMPDMATMLCFVMTDAQIAFPELKALVSEGVDKSFNSITVDGDTSTNDMVLVMANGMAGNQWLDEHTPEDREIFARALNEIFLDLALKIVEDGEGATKLVTIKVIHARDADGAMDAAQTIANSALVKTAFFGEDPNWGRIIAALGRSGCRFPTERVELFFDDVRIMENGMGLGGEDTEKAAQEVFKKDTFTVTVDLHDGGASAEVYTCDFSYDYVKINADYRS